MQLRLKDRLRKNRGNRQSGGGAQDSAELDTLHRIATTLTTTSLSSSHNREHKEPHLDPSDPKFDAHRWAQHTLASLNQASFTLQEQAVLFSSLSVSGSGASLKFQETVLSSFKLPFRMFARLTPGYNHNTRRTILHDFDGLLESGELLLVLGRPGSGCSTLLKTICGHLGGLDLDPKTTIQYKGIDFKTMIKRYRGELAYNQELDEHFPHLTVGETLSFAASARAPHQRPPGLTRRECVDTMVKIVMALFGLSHTYDTKVGDGFVRGVSGGERKRVSIAEMFLSRVRIGAWDNSTRGLDAASALQFIKSLRISADFGKACHAVAAYQCSQPMYKLFDKVIVLYEGREVYYGPCERASSYFEDMGWMRHPKQPIPDFLTAVTNPAERQARPGMSGKVPRTAAEFEKYWKSSPDYDHLKHRMEEFAQESPLNGEIAQAFHTNHTQQQAKHTREKSPYLLSVPMQVRLCLARAFQRLRNDLPTALSTVVMQIILSLIIGSIFFNSPDNTNGFFQKGAVLFFAVLMNALITINEIIQLYSQRAIVEKQQRYAFVHPFTEAIASALSDLPIKLFRCSIFSIVLYFMANLRREPAQFFVFYLFLITAILTMSAIFRTLGAATKSVSQAMSLAGVLVLCIIVYTGFTLPQTSMHPWFSWIRWINPIFYTFEALVSNEFHSRTFQCNALIPTHPTGSSFICSTVGAVVGQSIVSGDDFILQNYGYTYTHVWRNYGILVAFMLFFHITYFVSTELNIGDTSKAEALVFRPGHVPQSLQSTDQEGSATTNTLNLTSSSEQLANLPKHKEILMWKGLNYDIPVKDGTRRLLDDVSGWVKPGTLTALMGVSGAGKTTLLDVLAQRVSIGVVTGDISVSGKDLSYSFPRRTGYVQQQDMHLETATVREALRFSAALRQPRSVPLQNKYEYVEEVIQLLGMEEFAEAVVGFPGHGLNVEQRKLLSIGVELAAKPTLLIFLDEPTSGLDSQSSWTICQFLRKLVDRGQAILATIHQPNALLFQTFDRLLFLAEGGRTVYFGDIGPESKTVLDYFSSQGARPCETLENPAEYLLEMVSGHGAPGVHWPEAWKCSQLGYDVLAELDRLSGLPKEAVGETDSVEDLRSEFALPFHKQLHYVLIRVFQQTWRQPGYIFAKFVLGIVSGLFIGFSFWKANNTQQGFQNALFSIFLLCTIFSTLVNQIMPRFVVQRSLYEVRERPSRVYSWKAFILGQIIVEIPWQVLLGICSWASFYYAVFGASGSSESQGLILLFIIQFYVYAASMAQMAVAAVPDPALGAMLAVMMFGLSFLFNGVMQPPSALPRFWIFMYRVSPFTYYVSGISSTALHGREVVCSDSELRVFDPPSGQTCGEYLATYLKTATGRLYNYNATSACNYCSLSSADQYLAAREIYWGERWRNYGIFICYFAFNVIGTVGLYYLFRVRPQRARIASKKH